MLSRTADHLFWMARYAERAENTARMLDVKFHGTDHHAYADPHPEEEMPQDFYYWVAILRSVSAFEIYRKVNRDVITPERVVELLMLRADMPRSLLACMEEVVANLWQVRNNLSTDTECFAGRLHAELRFGSIDEILAGGLHDYLTPILERQFELDKRISRGFLVPMAA